MYLKKLKSITLCTILTFLLCSCNTGNSQSSPSTNATTECMIDSETSIPSQENTLVPIVNQNLGYQFDVAYKTSELLISDGNTSSITKDSLTYNCTSYYLNLGGFNQYAFTIYRINSTHTDEELLNHTPELQPLASSTDYTYAISTAPETPAELSYDDSQTYATILYKEIPELSKHFRIL